MGKFNKLRGKIIGTPAKTPLLNDEFTNSNDAFSPEPKQKQSQQSSSSQQQSQQQTSSSYANPKPTKQRSSTSASAASGISNSWGEKPILTPSPARDNSGKVSSARADSGRVSSTGDENQQSAVEIDYGLHNEDDELNEKKLGHKFFFCCCDTKRAVLYLNIIILMLSIFTFTAGIVQTDPGSEGFIRAVTVRACGIFITITTILGAYWYSKSVILVGMIYCCYQLAMGIIKMTRYDWRGLDGSEDDGKLQVIFPVFWQVLNFYAMAVFLLEVNDGTMSEETYQKREKYSCCCNC